FGPPGCGKTSLAQTCLNPLTLDFDQGVHRSFNRKRAMRFDTWADVEEAGREGKFKAYDTLIIDTGGRCLDTMIPEVIVGKKNSGPGGLSPQGWGVLGSKFTAWMKLVRSWRKQVVMICHQSVIEDESGNQAVIPDMPGKMALKEIHKNFDLIGR